MIEIEYYEEDIVISKAKVLEYLEQVRLSFDKINNSQVTRVIEGCMKHIEEMQ